MKLLITGASGRLGRSVVRVLKDTYELVLLTRGDGYSVPGAVMYKVDIEDTEALRAILQSEKPDVVIHLASIVGGACEANPRKAFNVNVRATEALALLADECGVKEFIFASTAAVYRQDKLEPTAEDSHVAPSTLYGETKLQAEELISIVAEKSATKFVSFRIFNIYGPGFDASLVNRLLVSSEANAVQLQGFKHFCRDYVYVDDVVAAITGFEKISMLSGYSIFNISSGRSVSNADLISELKDAGKSPFYDIVSDDRTFSWADIGRAHQALEFTPKSTLIFDW